MYHFARNADPPHDDAASRIPADVTCAPDSSTAGRPRVLIIDGDIDMLATVERTLRLEGIQTMAVGTGAEGLELARLIDFDMILIELRLMDMSGTDVVCALRRICSARIVLMSASLTVQTAVGAMKLGASDVVEKPLSVDALLATVRAGGQTSDSDDRAGERSPLVPARGRLAAAPQSVVERWVGYVCKACSVTADDPSGDFKTLEGWARRAAVSYSTLCETCRLLGIRPLDARDFARVLCVLRTAIVHGCAPEVLLNVSSRRVLRSLSARAGIDLTARAERASLHAFLTRQQFVPADSEALRLMRAFTVGVINGQ